MIKKSKSTVTYYELVDILILASNVSLYYKRLNKWIKNIWCLSSFSIWKKLLNFRLVDDKVFHLVLLYFYTCFIWYAITHVYIYLCRLFHPVSDNQQLNCISPGYNVNSFVDNFSHSLDTFIVLNSLFHRNHLDNLSKK